MSSHTAVPFVGVVFDFDGVLVSTAGVWDRAYDALFAYWGRTLDRHDRRYLATVGFNDLGHALAHLLDRTAPAHELAAQLTNLIASNAGKPITVLPGAHDLVRALHTTCPIAVASNSPTSIVERHLDAAGLARYFAVIVGADQVHRNKPAPDVYRRACSLLGVRAEQAVAIEDSDIGVAAARAEGLFTVGIGPSGQLSADATFPTLADPALWSLLGLTHPRLCPDREEEQ